MAIPNRVDKHSELEKQMTHLFSNAAIFNNATVQNEALCKTSLYEFLSPLIMTQSFTGWVRTNSQ